MLNVIAAAQEKNGSIDTVHMIIEPHKEYLYCVEN